MMFCSLAVSSVYAVCINLSNRVNRALNNTASYTLYMCTNHGTGHILMPDQFLDCPHVITGFEQKRGK